MLNTCLVKKDLIEKSKIRLANLQCDKLLMFTLFKVFYFFVLSLVVRKKVRNLVTNIKNSNSYQGSSK